MSGTAGAAFAAFAGAKVLVVEKQVIVGAGGPQTTRVCDRGCQLGIRYCRPLGWRIIMREDVIPVSQRFDGIMTIGIGLPSKIPFLHQYHQQRINHSNACSDILTNTCVVKLLLEEPGVPGSRAIGATIRRSAIDNTNAIYYEVKTKQVVFATGGFQSNAGLISANTEGGGNIFVRSNKGSVGGGLMLAMVVGAGTSRGMNIYYGRLLAAPLRPEDIGPKDFLLLAQYRKDHARSIRAQTTDHLLQKANTASLSTRAGRGFADETTGDEIVNQYLAKQENRLINHESSIVFQLLSPMQAKLIVWRKPTSTGVTLPVQPLWSDCFNILNQWGVSGSQALLIIRRHDRVVRLGDKASKLDAPVGNPPCSFVEGEGPLFAMEVHPSITFTYGGIRIDTRGHALTAHKIPTPALLVAGVDREGLGNLGHDGGLALASVTGHWAARTIAKELELPVPQLPVADSRDIVLDMETVIGVDGRWWCSYHVRLMSNVDIKHE
ncbi:hypothetical protein BBP40_003382 [Aspergillus hancockii]|nr:hypothetical protein BBP40_003382 [Aspergillus hancockii]